MKQKIAILTQPLDMNYGGIIQNYALQKVINDLGYQPMTVNRVPENPNSKFKILISGYKNFLFRNVFRSKKVKYMDNKQIAVHQKRFIKENIILSPTVATTNDLITYFKNENFQAVIVGSDQTWRPSYSPNIYNYFLDFLENDDRIMKLAYATSFGTSDWEFTDDETKRCVQLVQQFDGVSVREESAVEMTQKYLNKESVWVLDPTMLLNKSAYQKLIDGRRQPKRTGIYSYILDDTEEISAFIDSAQQILEMNHFTNQPKIRNKNKTSTNVVDYQYPTLEGWLQGFEEADFIITNSFHGTVFSIIFNKPFITIVNKERGASRFYSLLGKFDLKDRIIETAELSTEKLEKLAHQKVNFEHANKKLKEMKQESLSFLLNSLKSL